jgi:hypothetical protein
MTISSKLDQLSETIVLAADCWYTKSILPKIIKEFLFLFMVLTGTLIGDIGHIIQNKTKK